MDVHLRLASDNPNKETGVTHISLVGFKEQFKSFILLFLSDCEIDSSFLVNLLDFDRTKSLVLRWSNLYAIRQPSTSYSLKSCSCSLLIPPHHQQAYVNGRHAIFYSPFSCQKETLSYLRSQRPRPSLISGKLIACPYLCFDVGYYDALSPLSFMHVKYKRCLWGLFLAVFWLFLLFVPPALLFSSPFALLLSTHRIRYVNASKKGFSVPSLHKGASEHGRIFSLNIFTATSEPLILKSDMS